SPRDLRRSCSHELFSLSLFILNAPLQTDASGCNFLFRFPDRRNKAKRGKKFVFFRAQQCACNLGHTQNVGFNYPSVFADLEGIEESEVTVANCATSASSLSNAAILRRS